MFSKLKLILLRLSLSLAMVLSALPAYAIEGLILPQPGAMLALSQDYAPTILRGLKIDPQNPFSFDFMIDRGQGKVDDEQLKAQSVKLAKYFLTALTIPEKDLWVNLSPYESNRIITPQLGQTTMGVDLLAQDYILKQITASLIYPKGEVGKQFWAKVYTQAKEKFGTSDVPINTFNKVWIIPEKAAVYEEGQAVLINEARLKVMLEQDYLALEKNMSSPKVVVGDPGAKDTSALGSDIVREIVLPQLEREVNEGAHFAPLRQIFHSMILAVWYKQKIKDGLMAKAYVNHQKIKGVDTDEKDAVEKIYQRYLQAFKKGVFNYIQDPDPTDVASGEASSPKKYFSGGTAFDTLPGMLSHAMAVSPALASRRDFAMVRFKMNSAGDKAMFVGDLDLLKPLHERRVKTDWEKLVDLLTREGNDERINIPRLKAMLQPEAQDKRFDKVVFSTGSGQSRFETGLAKDNPRTAVIANDAYRGGNYKHAELFKAEYEQGLLPAQRLMREGKENINVIKGDVFDILPLLPDDSLDEFWMIAPEDAVLQRMLDCLRSGLLPRKLRPGGRLIIGVVYEDNYEALRLSGNPFNFDRYGEFLETVDTDWNSGYPLMQWVKPIVKNKEGVEQFILEDKKQEYPDASIRQVNMADMFKYNGFSVSPRYFKIGELGAFILQKDIIRLDLSAVDLQQMYHTLEAISEYIQRQTVDYIDQNQPDARNVVTKVLLELLRNAFVHGNKLDLTLPIYVHFDYDKGILDVYDMSDDRVISGDLLLSAQRLYLFGQGYGVSMIREMAGVDYQGPDVLFINNRKDKIGARVRVLFNSSNLIKRADRAMNVPNGGIDLDSANWKLDVAGGGDRALTFDAAQLASVDFEGLTPQLAYFVPAISAADFLSRN